MSISSTSLGGGSGWAMSAMRQRKQPPDMTKDQLTQIEQKMKANGKNTANLDKMISNFDQLDANQDGKVGMDELKAGAEKLGIELPPERPAGMGGPPPKMPDLSKDQLTDIISNLKADGKDTSNLEKLVTNFDQLDTDQDGTVSMDEIQAGAKTLGIDLPQGGGSHGHPRGPAASGSGQMGASWGPPPGLLESQSETDSTTGSSNQYLLKLLQSFGQTNSQVSESDVSNSVSIAA